MDEGSDSRFWPFLARLFKGSSEDPVEKTILEAREDGELQTAEAGMLLNVLRLGRKRVEDIFVPRTDIVCASTDSDFTEVAELVMETGHSRIPLYKGNRDHIVGILHAKDLFPALVDRNEAPAALTEIMREPFFIPETKKIMDLLQEFRVRKVHLAIALDEYGGTSGLVTFEDVLEEIVGEIEDEYDAPRPEEIQDLEGGRILVAGRTPLAELMEHMQDLDLESDQVETIGGYLCELAGRVPSTNETFNLEGHRFTIREADAKQVRWILIDPPQKTP